MKLRKSPWGKVEKLTQYGDYEGVFLFESATNSGVVIPKELALRLEIVEFGTQDFKSVWFSIGESFEIAKLSLFLNGFLPIQDMELKATIKGLILTNRSYIENINYQDYGGFGLKVKEITSDIFSELSP